MQGSVTLWRVLEKRAGEQTGGPPIDEWIAYLEARRQRKIAELQELDAILLEHGRLQHETIIRRQRG